MHAYVINLERRPDRLAQLSLPFPYTIVKAVDGRELPDSIMAEFRSTRSPLDVRKARAGCMLSHIKALEMAIDANNFPILILEDDVYLVTQELPPMPSDKLVCYYGALPRQGRKKYVMPESSGWVAVLTGVHLYGCHAYGIPTRKSAEFILQLFRNHKKFGPPDTILSALNNDRFVVHSPLLIHQRPGFSDITMTEVAQN